MDIDLKTETEPETPWDLPDFNINVKSESDCKRVQHWMFYQSNLLES